MNSRDLINKIETKFKTMDAKITALLEDSRVQNKLLTQIDFILKLGITVQEYDLLQDYNDVMDLSEKDIKRLMNLNEALEKKYKYIDLINEKIILSCTDWKVVNRNTIGYILNKNKSKNDKSNVVMNIYVDESSKNKLDLQELGFKIEDE